MIIIWNLFEIAIDYLDKNNIDVDWLGVFTQDAFPMNENFWDVLDEKINKHKDFKKLVGSFGFNVLFLSVVLPFLF